MLDTLFDDCTFTLVFLFFLIHIILSSIPFSTHTFRAEVHSEKLKRLSSSRDQEEKLRAYRKFMFVRQPFERVVSAYRDKLVGVDGLYDFHKIVGMKIEEKYR